MIANTKFTKNKAVEGGALSGIGTDFMIIESVFCINLALKAAGACLFFYNAYGICTELDDIPDGNQYKPNYPDISFYNTTFQENNANTIGGAIYFLNCKQAFFSECKFIKNNATNAGGAIISKSTNASFTDCDFFQNLVDTRRQNLNSSIFKHKESMKSSLYFGGSSIFFMSEDHPKQILTTKSCCFSGNQAVRLYNVQNETGIMFSNVGGSILWESISDSTVTYNNENVIVVAIGENRKCDNISKPTDSLSEKNPDTISDAVDTTFPSSHTMTNTFFHKQRCHGILPIMRERYHQLPIQLSI